MGIQIGDALAMPVHWYYDRDALFNDYGRVTDFVAPKSPHPGSILWRSHWKAPSEELDILAGRRHLWGQRNVHYHQDLAAGEPTLTAQLGAEVWRSLCHCGGFDAGDSLGRYIELLRHPQRHRDTYLEECHRGFFSNLGRGKPPEESAIVEKHIGGLIPMLAVAIFYAEEPATGREHALRQLALTHAGGKMRVAAEAILNLLERTFAGESLEEAVLAECRDLRNPHFDYPFEQWLKRGDREVVGRRVSPACYVEGAVPAVIYLALKYSRRAEEGLIANSNLGGDNVHRGSVLGALLGAEEGMACWPQRWIDGLVSKDH